MLNLYEIAGIISARYYSTELDERSALQAVIDACMDRLSLMDNELRHMRVMCIHDYDGRVCKICGYTRHKTMQDP